MIASFIGYVKHYLSMPDSIIFFAVAFILLLLIVTCLSVFARVVSNKNVDKEQKSIAYHIEINSLVERFYELVFSGTSILFFMAVYYLIERFLLIDSYRSIWDKYHDFLLLFLIVLSCMLNTFLDKIFARLMFLDKDEKASIRLLGMFYMILIFAYIKFIYENNNYDAFISYFIGLMVGRFVYFDASFTDFIERLRDAFRSTPLMLLLLSYTALLSLYGFKSEYLLIHNGVVTNVFIAHLFMCGCIFIVHRVARILFIIKKKL